MSDDLTLDAISRLGILERAGDPGLTALTRLAAYVSGARGAAIHIPDDAQQHRIAATGAPLGAGPREDSMCRLVVDSERRIVCADASRDPRFGYSSFVQGEEPVRFYASMPLRTSEGEVLGALCAFDTRALEVDAQQLALLEDLADQTTAQIELTKVAVDLGRLAAHDSLTGAANRLVLGDRLAQAFARRRRHGGETILALLDVDDFKRINDGYGHAAGDEVLVEIVRRLRRAMRAEDTIARIGGDEFVVLAERVRPDDGERQLCARIETALGQPMECGSTLLPVRASVGGVLAIPGESLRELLGRADVAMYRHKHDRRAPATAIAAVS